MRDWAEQQQRSSDAPGMGRNPRARRQFRQMRDAADFELDRRGLLWPDVRPARSTVGWYVRRKPVPECHGTRHFLSVRDESAGTMINRRVGKNRG